MKKLFYILLVISTSIISCKKLVEVEGPINQITSELVFADDASATSAITGLYNRIMSNNSYLLSGGMSIYSGLTADELINNTPNSDDEFTTNSISTGNSIVGSNFWAGAFSIIFHCNSIIEGLDKSDKVTQQTKNQLKGEALFIKALSFFYLTNIFGDVPLINSTDYRANANMPRTLASSVYEQIISDLKLAEQLLKTAYVGSEKLRPNKYTVQALLARVFLYKKDWTNAELYSSSVINSGNYILPGSVNSVFLSNSSETIWQLMPSVASVNTWEGNMFIPPTGSVPNYSLQQSLRNSFDLNDQRLNNWVGLTIVSSITYTFPYKYKVRNGLTISEYLVVLRLAEQYLIRAEARAQQNNLSSSLVDLNIVRNRAGLTNVSSSSQTQILSFIEEERRKELFAEFGHRWLDLKRTSRADAVLSILKAPNWQPTDVLFPIPILEIRKNPALTQNSGY